MGGKGWVGGMGGHTISSECETFRPTDITINCSPEFKNLFVVHSLQPTFPTRPQYAISPCIKSEEPSKGRPIDKDQEHLISYAINRQQTNWGIL